MSCWERGKSKTVCAWFKNQLEALFVTLPSAQWGNSGPWLQSSLKPLLELVFLGNAFIKFRGL